MKRITIIAGLLGMIMLPGIGHAQSCGNDSIYKIPYKDTYVKQALWRKMNSVCSGLSMLPFRLLPKPRKCSQNRFGQVMKKKSTCIGVLGKSE